MEDPISKSRILAYINCPFGYKLRYVQDLKTETNIYCERGIKIHDVANKFFDGFPEFKGNLPIVAMKMTSYIKGLCEDGDYEKYKDYFKNFINLESKRYMKVGYDRFKPLYRELHVEDKVAGLHGYVDRVDKTKKGNYIVWDYKTGTIGGMKAKNGIRKYMIELTVYAHLIMKKDNFPAELFTLQEYANMKDIPLDKIWVGIIDLKKGKKYKVKLTQKNLDDMLKLKDKVVGLIEKEHFPRVKKCPYFCDYKKICKEAV